MCGIAGILTPTPEVARLNRVADQLAHRGPDDRGVLASPGAGLVVRRLSIIDIEGGHQPVPNEDETVWVVQNGEILNSPALRKELRAAGHTFRTESDTEVLVHAYEEWGDAFVSRLRGMFALAIWDIPNQRLLLARDRFGIKPLYYARSPSGFAFASEIQPLFTLLPDLQRGVDPTGLRQTFEIGYPIGPRTAFENIHKLPAACWMVVDEPPAVPEPYWSLQIPPNGHHLNITQEEAAEGLLDRLRRAVDRWRLSDVPVGMLLSGGIDSASLAALLTEATGRPIRTFTIAFDAATHDEARAARETARALGSDHRELTFSGASFDWLPELIDHLEVPLNTLTCIPLAMLYRVCHEAGFKVIMTGEGADELFGGYFWFRGDRSYWPYLHLPEPIRRTLAALRPGISARARYALQHGAADPVGRYTRWHTPSTPRDREELMLFGDDSLEEDLRERFAEDLRVRHPFHQFVYLDAHTRMTDYINFQVDRMSMLSSVEARPPFMDRDLWEWSVQLPPSFHLSRQGHKMLLRDAMRLQGALPDSVLARTKKPLSAPHVAWWRNDRLPDWAEDHLTPSALKSAGFFSLEAFDRLRGEHQSGRANHSRMLNGVLTTQLWAARVLRVHG